MIRKITNGYVVQTYDKERGRFVSQEFISSDEVDYEDEDGAPLEEDEQEIPEGAYLPFDMMQPEEDPECIGEEYSPLSNTCFECKHEVECMQKNKKAHPECWHGDDWI